MVESSDSSSQADSSSELSFSDKMAAIAFFSSVARPFFLLLVGLFLGQVEITFELAALLLATDDSSSEADREIVRGMALDSSRASALV